VRIEGWALTRRKASGSFAGLFASLNGPCNGVSRHLKPCGGVGDPAGSDNGHCQKYFESELNQFPKVATSDHLPFLASVNDKENAVKIVPLGRSYEGNALKIVPLNGPACFSAIQPRKLLHLRLFLIFLAFPGWDNLSVKGQVSR
jgi:hypothetical protein